MKNKVYRKTISLNHHEIPAKIDLKSGEVTPVLPLKNNMPEGKDTMGKKEIGWRKSFDGSWDFLEEVLNSNELRVAGMLSRKAQMNTNCIIPFNHDTSIINLAEEFKLDHRKTKQLFKKLFDLGVYGQFSVAEVDKEYTKYWILNPYLAFKGKLIDSDIKHLFRNTRLTIEYYRRINKNK